MIGKIYDSIIDLYYNHIWSPFNIMYGARNLRGVLKKMLVLLTPLFFVIFVLNWSAPVIKLFDMYFINNRIFLIKLVLFSSITAVTLFIFLLLYARGELFYSKIKTYEKFYREGSEILKNDNLANKEKIKKIIQWTRKLACLPYMMALHPFFFLEHQKSLKASPEAFMKNHEGNLEILRKEIEIMSHKVFWC